MLDAIQALLAWEFLPWSVLGILAMGWLFSVIKPELHDDPVKKLTKLFGYEDTSETLVAFISVLWALLFGLLFLGLMWLIAGFIWETTNPETSSETTASDFRFMIAKIAALTAVLGGLVALPFTALRLKEMRKSNEELKKQTQHNEDVLFNDKLHEANSDLHARYQVTERDEEDKPRDIWKDDIIKRNGAIQRLEKLAEERPSEAPSIANIL